MREGASRSTLLSMGSRLISQQSRSAVRARAMEDKNKPRGPFPAVLAQLQYCRVSRHMERSANEKPFARSKRAAKTLNNRLLGSS